jgi:hypothetical protein
MDYLLFLQVCRKILKKVRLFLVDVSYMKISLPGNELIAEPIITDLR